MAAMVKNEDLIQWTVTENEEINTNLHVYNYEHKYIQKPKIIKNANTGFGI